VRYVSQFCITVTNTRDNQLIKRKGLFLPLVSEVSVQDWLAIALGLWYHIMARTHPEQNHSSHGQAVGKKKGVGGRGTGQGRVP
jgi:hypothetical protein